MIILLYHQAPREFRAKLFAAHQLASHFGSVVLARTAALESVLRALPGRHVIVEIGLTPKRAQRFIDLRGRGHVTLSYDEEASGARDIRDHRKFALGNFGPDYVLLFGSYHRVQMDSLLREHAQSSFVIGHPRFDVMRPSFRGLFDDEVRTSRPYSLHVLKPTNIAPGDERSAYNREVTRIKKKQALANHLNAVHSNRSKVDFRIPSWAEFRSESRLRLADLAVQVDTARSLRDEFGLLPVLRPRLEVEPRVLRRQMSAVGLRPRDLLTMRISRKRSLSGQIHGAQCVVQFGCTSAIEASIAQKPLLHIDADHRDFAQQSDVTRRLGTRVADGEQAAGALAQELTAEPSGAQFGDSVQVKDLSVARLKELIVNDERLNGLSDAYRSRNGELSPTMPQRVRHVLRRASSSIRSAQHAPANSSVALKSLSWLDERFSSDSSLRRIAQDSFIISAVSSELDR